jgi:hypothetical protein
MNNRVVNDPRQPCSWQSTEVGQLTRFPEVERNGPFVASEGAARSQVGADVRFSEGAVTEATFSTWFISLNGRDFYGLISGTIHS